jgi:hypothetical protein
MNTVTASPRGPSAVATQATCTVGSGGTWLLQKSVQKDLTVKKDGEVFFHQAK